MFVRGVYAGGELAFDHSQDDVIDAEEQEQIAEDTYACVRSNAPTAFNAFPKTAISSSVKSAPCSRQVRKEAMTRYN